jgi:hypothetical protein
VSGGGFVEGGILGGGDVAFHERHMDEIINLDVIAEVDDDMDANSVSPDSHNKHTDEIQVDDASSLVSSVAEPDNDTEIEVTNPVNTCELHSNADDKPLYTQSRPPSLSFSQIFGDEEDTGGVTIPAVVRRKSLSPKHAKSALNPEFKYTKPHLRPSKSSMSNASVADFVPENMLNTPRRFSIESFESFASPNDEFINQSPDPPRYQYPPQEDLFSKGNIFLVFALTCAHMKTQAEGAVLRNIIALQRSFILYPNTTMVPPTGQSPFFHSPSTAFPARLHSARLPGNRVNTTHDLEVIFIKLVWDTLLRCMFNYYNVISGDE